mgnify:CR=1 FL=1
MKQQNFEVGRLGEKLAGEYLERQGYKIIKRNFRTRFGELDLIATKNANLVFVEVKLKIGEDFGSPEEMIDRKKLKQIEKTAQSFLIENPVYERKYAGFQIDAVCIVLDETRNVKRITQYENIGF